MARFHHQRTQFPSATTLPDPSRPGFRTALKRLSREADPEHRLTLALGLHTVVRRRLYQDWGFPTFSAYCQRDLAVHIETARTLCLLTKELLARAKLSPDALRQIGWTKAKILIPLARQGRITPKTKEMILQRAIALPSDELRDWVHQELHLFRAHRPKSFLHLELNHKDAAVIARACRLTKQTNGFQTLGQQLAMICRTYLQDHAPHRRH